VTMTLDDRTETIADTVAADTGSARRGTRVWRVAMAAVAAGAVFLCWMSVPHWGVGLPSEVPVSISGEARALTLPEFGARGSYVLDYVDGAVITVAVPIRNDGRFGVDVTGVRLTDEPRPLLEQLAGDGLRVHVPAGGEATIVIRARLANCAYYHEREVARYGAATLTYEVLGRQATRAVPLEHDLVVHAPMIVGCPDGKLDRSLLNRRP
jgi:hypothetical protein